jgi:hypothetical protein
MAAICAGAAAGEAGDRVPQHCRGWGGGSSRNGTPPPGKFLNNSLVSLSVRCRFTKWRMKRDDQTLPTRVTSPPGMEPDISVGAVGSLTMSAAQPGAPSAPTPGRYALVVKGQAYDFTVAGEITETAQCLERTEAANGTFYSECRTLD